MGRTRPRHVLHPGRRPEFCLPTGRRPLRRALAILCLLYLILIAHQEKARADLTDAASPQRPVAESYRLPITPPLDQGDSNLCWGYAALSMLETNYLVRHPGSRIMLSRGALQRDAIADRFHRRLRGEPGRLTDGGLSVEALALIRRHGLVARGDYHHAVASARVFSALKRKLARRADTATKHALLERELEARLGAKPEVTQLDGRSLTPEQLADAVLGHERWVEFDRSRGGAEGPGPSRDPEARLETRVVYVRLPTMIDLIHRSLARGQAVVAGTDDHAFLVYGADYDEDGRPLSYLIKDSLAPLTRREAAEALHAELNDVTVAVE